MNVGLVVGGTGRLYRIQMKGLKQPDALICRFARSLLKGESLEHSPHGENLLDISSAQLRDVGGGIGTLCDKTFCLQLNQRFTHDCQTGAEAFG